MSLITQFIVLIERRLQRATQHFTALIERRRLPRAAVAAATAVAVVLSGFAPAASDAAPPAHKPGKVARDLEAEVTRAGPPKARWARDINGVRHIQAVVVSNSADPEMASLRSMVQAIGGSVHAAHPWMGALTVQIPANQIQTLAQRSDVVSVTPNRVTRRTASTLESITGALASNVRTGSTKTRYSGLDGTNIGIAVLDSGVMKAHEAFFNGSGVTRVKKNVNMLNGTLANWTSGVSGTPPPRNSPFSNSALSATILPSTVHE